MTELPLAPLEKERMSEQTSKKIETLEQVIYRTIYPIWIPFEYISKIISIIAASSQIKELLVEEEERTVSSRAQIHGYIYAKYDSFKSTIVDEIKKAFPEKTVVPDKYSLPSLIGTIDQYSHAPIIPLAWRANQKLLIFDEFDRQNKGLIGEAFKQLLEHQEYRRVLGYPTAKPVNKPKQGLVIKENMIWFRSQFSLLILSMDSPAFFARDNLGKALLSRMLIMQYELTNEQIYDVLKGKPIFTKYNFPVQEKITVKRQDYEKILEQFQILNEGDHPEPRTLGDMVRTFAVTQEHDSKLYEIIHSLHKHEIKRIESRKKEET